MKTLSSMLLLLLGAAMASAVQAGPREDLLDRYAKDARANDPGFTSFSATRGQELHLARHTTGKPDTPSCSQCHGDKPRNAGRTPTGKSIEPMAVSATPTRYTDAAKVEKWFRRNCNEVLGRACTPAEKGDWLAYMISQ
ncbi:MAG: DUF1924 domain-containing protein [Rhodocyclaceae bacterium]|nr:DUF1924 domain-containing protein [Rhodocyclaceae bacterium]MCP5238925.1 DUF1924 domain-containing protein [Zoogloeaceae bacterium]MCP5254187.1 DUF1924 domain-containing protein [Zoogloeaceae bacterium]MCP5295361.1 DUF1924 domain-containing protein [Zoogloeaceae bacterium]